MNALLFLLAVGTASAYELAGSSWTWQTDPIQEPFQLNLNTFPSEYLRSEVEDGYIAAFPIWNGQSRSGLQLVYGGQTSATAAGAPPDGVNMARWVAASPDIAVALSSRIIDLSEPTKVVECDIQFYGSNTIGPIVWSFDTQDGAGADEYNFLYTAVHELGHCLGLSHSADNSAVMRAVQSKGLGADAWNLTADDVAGIQELYGVVEPDIVLSIRAAPPDLENPEGAPGSVFPLTISVDNVGTGTAYDVRALATLESGGTWVSLPNNTAEMGDVVSGQTSGTLESDLVFNLIVPPDCTNAGTASIGIDVTDASGSIWSTNIDIEISCPPVDREYVDEIGGTWSPGCATAPGTQALWLLGLPMLLMRRRLTRV